MLLHERYVNQIADEVVARLKTQSGGASAPGSAPASEPTATPGRPAGNGGSSGPVASTHGVFGDVDEAISAALAASREVAAISITRRGEIVEEMRRVALENLEYLARLAVEETGMGRVEDKINKNRLVAEQTPGVEDLDTWAISGRDGLTLEEYAPYGVIGAVIPSTNPTETVINNGIGMFAAGNAVVFNPHPNATRCSLAIMSMLNDAIAAAGGPRNTFCAVAEPTIESAAVVMKHPAIPFLAVTGSEGVVKAAMQAGKKIVAAGPGNPPAVVDETADIPKAARDIVAGGSLDNNIVCIAEKETVVVAAVADALLAEMERAGAYRATPNQIRQIESTVFSRSPEYGKHTPVKREFVGKNASVILEAIGVRDAGDPRMIICDVPEDHPFAWSEMMMPVMPVVRVPDVDRAIEYAVAVEQGNRHTAAMHSTNIDKLMEMGRRIGCSIYVKNGPTFAGVGLGGEGYTSFTIASPTGDGLTTARTFSRKRRCALIGDYRFV